MEQQTYKFTEAGTPLGIEIVANDRTDIANLRNELSALADVPIYINNTTEGFTAAADVPLGTGATIVFVNGDVDGAIRFIGDRAVIINRPALLAAISDRSAPFMRRVINAGADDILFYPLDRAPATRTLMKIQMHLGVAERIKKCQFTAVTSLSGGMGVSSVAANLAYAMRYAMNQRVALIDLDGHSGGLAGLMNVTPAQTLSSLLASGRKLDSVELGGAMTQHPSGAYLLADTLPIDRGVADAEDGTMAPVLDLLEDLFDHVIVDCGRSMSRRVMSAVERASDTLYVFDQHVNSIRGAIKFAELYSTTSFGPAPVRFVLNRHDANHPASIEQIEYALGRPVYAQIPADDRSILRSEARGVDLWKLVGKCSLTAAYEDIARALVDRKNAHVNTQQALVPRLLAAVGARVDDTTLHSI